MFSGNFFIYGDVNSRQYELIMASVNNDDDKNIGGQLEYSTFFKRNGKSDIVSARHKEEEFSFPIEMVKMNKEPIEFAEHQTICREFFNSPTFKKLQIDDGAYVGMYLMAYITDVSVITAGNGMVGYSGTCVCNSRYFFEDKKYTYYSNRKDTDITILNNTTLGLYTPVNLEFTTGDVGGDCTIKTTCPKSNIECEVKFKSLPRNTTVKLTYDPKNVYVSNDAYQKTVYTSESNWNKRWLTFVQGYNTLRFSGDVQSLTIEYQATKSLFVN